MDHKYCIGFELSPFAVKVTEGTDPVQRNPFTGLAVIETEEISNTTILGVDLVERGGGGLVHAPEQLPI